MRTFKFAGNGANKVFLTDVKGVIVTAKNTTQTVALAKTLAGWGTLINPATTAGVLGTYIDFERGMEPKSAAPEMTTSNTGFEEKTKDFPPKFVGHAYISWADYLTWFAADTKEFDFVLVLNNGDLMTAVTTAGLQKGFCGRMFITYDLPKPGGAEKQKACPFDIIFDDVEEWKNYQIIKTGFTRKELSALAPVGINIEVLTAYSAATGIVVLKATKRATGEAYTGFTTFVQWEVVSLTADTGGAATAIDVTQAALGIYSVTFLNSAAKLTDDFEIQAVTVAATHITYLSNVLNVPI